MELFGLCCLWWLFIGFVSWVIWVMYMVITDDVQLGIMIYLLPIFICLGFISALFLVVTFGIIIAEWIEMRL